MKVRSSDPAAILAEDDQVRREGVVRRILPPKRGERVVIAVAGQPGARLDHQDLEIVLVAEEGETGGKVQALAKTSTL